MTGNRRNFLSALLAAPLARVLSTVGLGSASMRPVNQKPTPLMAHVSEIGEWTPLDSQTKILHGLCLDRPADYKVRYSVDGGPWVEALPEDHPFTSVRIMCESPFTVYSAGLLTVSIGEQPCWAEPQKLKILGPEGVKPEDFA